MKSEVSDTKTRSASVTLNWVIHRRVRREMSAAEVCFMTKSSTHSNHIFSLWMRSAAAQTIKPLHKMKFCFLFLSLPNAKKSKQKTKNIPQKYARPTVESCLINPQKNLHHLCVTSWTGLMISCDRLFTRHSINAPEVHFFKLIYSRIYSFYSTSQSIDFCHKHANCEFSTLLEFRHEMKGKLPKASYQQPNRNK